MTILFADLVDSTVLSTRVEPETYRMLVGRYRDQVLSIVDRFEGHVGSTKGDGLLAVFGHPAAHEDDVRRAVLAGLEITRAGGPAQRAGTAPVRGRHHCAGRRASRAGVSGHRPGRRVRVGRQPGRAGVGSGAAGSVVVSDAVAPLVRTRFELQARPAAAVKGVEGLIAHHLVIGERIEPARVSRGPLVGRDRELARLQKCWARAQTGTLTTPGVVFRGEPGIGKSRSLRRPPSWSKTPGRWCWSWWGRRFTPTPACTRCAR